MAAKKNDDQDQNPDKLNFSKTQLTVIIGSIAAIVVLALAVGFLTKKNDAQVEEQAAVEAPPAEQATEMPLPDGAKKEELSKLEGTLPKQVPLTPEEELKQKAEHKAEKKPEAAPQPVPAAPVPAAQPKAAAPAPAPGAIVEKTAPKPSPAIEEKSAEPKKEKKAKREKPKKKRVHAIHRKTPEPLKKQLDVKKVNAAPKAEPRKEPKETGEAPVQDTKAGKLENKPGPSSFRTRLPDTLRPMTVAVEPSPDAKPDAIEPGAAAPVTAEAPAKPAPAAAPEAAEPKFALLAETVASEADAKSRVAALKKSGYQAYYLKTVTTKNTWYRVMAGAYATQEEADAAAAEFGRKEHAKAKVLPYEKP
ncbi:MAG: SPOR domain-containing protein [Nitrospinae bacterium]|nr:SPOR domain-containing protein [Nitrospinota bacterium]